MEVTQVRFAEIAGASRQIVSYGVKRKHLVLNSAGYLDTDNPLNARFIKKWQAKRKQGGGKRELSAGGDAPPPPASLPAEAALGEDAYESPGALLGMTLGELFDRYQDIEGLDRYARILASLRASADKETRERIRRNELIERDFVETRIFTGIDNLFENLMKMPERSVDEVLERALARGREARQDVMEFMQRRLSEIAVAAKEVLRGRMHEGVSH